MRGSTVLRPIAPGADVIEALAELSLAGEAWIDASGHIEDVELRMAGEGADPVRALRGRYTLVHLGGAAGGPFSVTLSRWSSAGLEMAGGILLRGRSGGITAAIHPCAPTLAASIERGPAAER